jgi:hypothetical protein
MQGHELPQDACIVHSVVQPAEGGQPSSRSSPEQRPRQRHPSADRRPPRQPAGSGRPSPRLLRVLHVRHGDLRAARRGRPAPSPGRMPPLAPVTSATRPSKFAIHVRLRSRLR